MTRKKRRKRTHPPGTRPGTLAAHAEADAVPVRIRAIAYTADGCEERELSREQLSSVEVPGRGVLWLDVWGLSDPGVVQAIGDRFGFHPLALEDVLNIPQRPKVERYGDHLLVVLREVRYPEEPEQVSLFLREGVVVSFQERPGDPFEPVRDRIRRGQDRIRSLGPDYLLYSLCDAVLDAFFPTLEQLGDRVEELEDRVVRSPVPETLREVRRLKRSLLEVRRAAWPARDAVNDLLREGSPLISLETKIFLRDCYDHAVQVMDMVETYREMAASLVDEYLSMVSNRLNEVVKILTMVATIFIPLTFLAGIYGMNFDREASPFNMPELGWRYGYPAVLLVMAVTLVGMLVAFRRKGWL